MTELNSILEKALSFERLDDKELLYLLEEKEGMHDIVNIADIKNQKINSDKVSYVVNRNINFTNICGLNCRFCGYKRTEKSKDAFLLGYDEILEKISDGKNRIGIDEICVTGGINPDLKPDYYFNLVKVVRDAFPDIHIHAFSPQEILELSMATGKPYKDVILKLVELGLNSMPGTAAEILAEETRGRICPEKLSAAQWVEIIKTAHGLGVKTSATILFGHVETNPDIVYHLSLIRQIQDETNGFTEFIALPFISYKTSLRKKVDSTLVRNRVLEFYAILRLYLDNFKNIQTSWPKIGAVAALKSLECGVNDFGGTLMEENITKSAGGNFGEYLPEDEIIGLIKSAGKLPVRRDTLYNYICKENYENKY